MYVSRWAVQPPYTVRPTTPSDLPAVCAIDYEAFAPYGTAEAPEVFTKRLAVFPDGFVVLTAGNEIVGYGCAEKWLTEREPALDEDPTLTHHPAGRVFCITGMAVRRAQWRRGFGTALLERLLTIAQEQGCEKIVLETTHAVGLYAKRGFRVVKMREQGGAWLTVMELAL